MRIVGFWGFGEGRGRWWDGRREKGEGMFDGGRRMGIWGDGWGVRDLAEFEAGNEELRFGRKIFWFMEIGYINYFILGFYWFIYK